MAVTVNNVNEELIKFRKKAIWSFLRDSRFDAYTGAGPNNIIQRVMDLEANGKQINIPLHDSVAVIPGFHLTHVTQMVDELRKGTTRNQHHGARTEYQP